MPYKDAFTYITSYLTQRPKAMNNEVRQRWFTSDSGSLAALLLTFDTQAENVALDEANKTDGSSPFVRQAYGLKIATLAGWYHNVKSLFVASTDYRARLAVDASRFAYSKLNFNRLKVDNLRRIIDAKEQA